MALNKKISTARRKGLAPKLSGSSSDVLRGDGTYGPLVAAYTAWVPTFTAATGTPGTITVGFARYQIIGNTCFFSAFFTITDNGTAGVVLRMSLPVTVTNGAVGQGFNGTTGKMIWGQIQGNSINKFAMAYYDGTYPVATGDGVVVSGFYETT